MSDTPRPFCVLCGQFVPSADGLGRCKQCIVDDAVEQRNLAHLTKGRPDEDRFELAKVHAADHLAGSRHVALDLLRRGTAEVGTAMTRPMFGSDDACLVSVLGILISLLGPLPPDLDSTRARCYKSKYPRVES